MVSVRLRLAGEHARHRSLQFRDGGKDGHPYPVNRDVYDGTVSWLSEAVAKAKMDIERLKRSSGWGSGVLPTEVMSGRSAAS